MSDDQPPRMWGKPLSSNQLLPCRRSTPTDVGKTIDDNALVSAFYDQPPRMWGKHQHADRPDEIVRSTPTDVGKTLISCIIEATGPINPHGCGENDYELEVFCGNHDQPPRMWGKRTAGRTDPVCHRSTPTDVGKTLEKMPSPSKWSHFGIP